MIVTLVVLLALLGHGYVWVGIVNRLHGLGGARKLIVWASYFCILCFLALPAATVWRWEVLELETFRLSGSSASLLKAYVYFCASWGVVKLLLLRFDDRQRDQPDTLLSWRQERSPLAEQLDSNVYQGTYPRLLSLAPGNQSLLLTIDYKKLRIPRLPARYEGIRIAHLSDLHMTGRLGRRLFEVVVEQVNQLQADAVMITGDIVENDSCLPWLAESLAHLRAKYGVYFILGNHDYYIDSSETLRRLTDAGLHYLEKNWLEVQWQGEPVVLAGNELPWRTGTAAHPAAPPRREDQLPLRISLMHTPDQFGWAQQHDVDLALAGHVHGGQFRLPILGPVACPSLYGTRYACGVFRQGNTVMHVTRGISGVLPLRWNCLPEIAILELAKS
ncbi:MAG: metallophosphoesterase [Pirellulales bacterium]|nr:metallophosphoesterase [Pirellulales bacterium]